MTVVAEADDGREAVEKTASLKPEVAVLDIAMPNLNGIEAWVTSVELKLCKLFYTGPRMVRKKMDENGFDCADRGWGYLYLIVDVVHNSLQGG